MTPGDLVILVLLLTTVGFGWYQGLTSAVGTLVGFLLGVAGGRYLMPFLSDWLQTAGPESAPLRDPLSFALPLLLGCLGAIVLGSLAVRLRERFNRTVAKPVDSLGGAFAGGLAFLLVVWLFAGWVRTTPWVEPNRWVAQSQAVAALDRIAPIDSATALGSIGQALTANGFPQVFDGQAEIIRGIGEPDPAMVEVGKEVQDSVVKVLSHAPTCQAVSEGSGWVYAPGLVATNAHVVAGAESITVQVGGTGEPYTARLVAFDPESDAAILRVENMSAPALEEGADLNVGESAVVVGFPENGPYTIAPSRTRDQLRARGLDIYGEQTVMRDIYSLRGIVRQGNSGGPLIDSDGKVVGMVFAKSSTDAETGYALTLSELDSILRTGKSATAQVQSGHCVRTDSI